MIRSLKIGLIATILVYCCGMLYTYYSNTKFNESVAFYDIDKNGVIDGNEITKNSKAIANQMAKRKTTDQAIMILIPFSIIIGSISFGIAFLFKKIKIINDNEIDYRKRQH